jgi:O-antigen/teichoic acid export membrane protein
MNQVDRRRFIAEGAWIIVGQVLSAIGTILGLRLLTALLTPHVFGEVVLVSGIVLLANGIASNPLMQGVLRYYPDSAAANDVAAFRIAINRHLRTLTVLTSVICLVGFLFLSQFTAVNLWLGPLTAALLVVDVLRQRELTLFNASRCQRISAIWIATEAWARPSFACAMIILMGATAVVTLIGYVVASVALFLVFRQWAITGTQNQNHSGIELASTATPSSKSIQGHGGCRSSDPGLPQALMRYTLPLMPLGVIGWISGQADRYLIGGIIGVEEAGIYAALYGIASRPFLMAAGTLESWLRPLYYQAVSAHAPRQSKRVFLMWLIAIMSVAIVGTVAFSLWHKEIAAVLLARPYRADSWLMPWIAVGYGLLLVAQVYQRVCYAHNETLSVLLTEALGSMVALIVTVYGLKQFGLAGAAYALPLCFGVQLVAALVFARNAERRSVAVLLTRQRVTA